MTNQEASTLQREALDERNAAVAALMALEDALYDGNTKGLLGWAEAQQRVFAAEYILRVARTANFTTNELRASPW